MERGREREREKTKTQKDTHKKNECRILGWSKMFGKTFLEYVEFE